MNAAAAAKKKERIVPKSVVEAERAVLGSALIDTHAAFDAISRLSHQDFYSDQHRTIFKAIINIIQRDRTIDQVTLTEKLRDEETIGEVGGKTYILDLINSVSTAKHIDHYAFLVREASLDRQIDDQLHKTSQDKTDANMRLLQSLMDAWRNIRTKPSFDFQKDFPRFMDSLDKKLIDTVDTGFPSLDHKLGGVGAGHVCTIGARTSGGKTASMMKIAVAIAAKQQKPVAFITTEMKDEELVERVLPAAAMVPVWRFKKRVFRPEDYKKITDACADYLSKLPLKITGKSLVSLSDIRSVITSQKPRVVFIDYLQRCQMPKGDIRAYQVMEFMITLKTLAQETGVSIFIGCQLDRGLDRDPDREPENSDLKDSGAIESESDQVILLWKPSPKRILKENIFIPDGNYLIRAKISKNRHGPAWHQADFFLNGQYVDFVERIQPEPQQPFWTERSDLQ